MLEATADRLLPLVPAEEESSPMDKLLDKVGSTGTYQWLSFLVYGMHWFILGWLLMGISFYYETKLFECPNLEQKECQEYVCSLPASQWSKYLPHRPNTISYEWEWLVCDNEYLISLLEALFAAGACIGLVVFAHLADNIGRKWAVSSGWACLTVGLALTGFANGIIMATCGQFLIGFGLNSVIVLDFAFINEFSTGKARQYFSVGVQIFLAVAECIVGYVMYWADNWRLTFYVLLGVAIVVNILHYFLLQTPKYMISKSIDKTVDILNKVGKINGGEEVTYDEVLEVYEKEQVADSDSANIIVLFRYSSLRVRTLCCALVFFGIQIIYTCAILSVGSIGFESRENQLVMGISEGLAYIVAQIVVPYVKRRAFVMATMSLSGLLCLSIALLTLLTDELNVLELTLMFAMRFVACMLYAVLFVFVTELYPTKVRSLGLGFTYLIGTFGTFFSPFILLLADTTGLNRWLIPGAVGLIATLGVIALPETKGKPMQEEIYERKKSTIMKTL